MDPTNHPRRAWRGLRDRELTAYDVRRDLSFVRRRDQTGRPLRLAADALEALTQVVERGREGRCRQGRAQLYEVADEARLKAPPRSSSTSGPAGSRTLRRSALPAGCRARTGDISFALPTRRTRLRSVNTSVLVYAGQCGRSPWRSICHQPSRSSIQPASRARSRPARKIAALADSRIKGTQGIPAGLGVASGGRQPGAVYS